MFFVFPGGGATELFASPSLNPAIRFAYFDPGAKCLRQNLFPKARVEYETRTSAETRSLNQASGNISLSKCTSKSEPPSAAAAFS